VSSTKHVGDADGGGVGAEAKAAAVIAGEGGVGVDGNVERVDESIVFGDVVAGDDGGFAIAGRAVDLLVADGKLLVGLGLKVDAAQEFDAEADLEVGQRAERGVIFGEDTVDESGGVACTDLEIRGDAAEAALEVVAEVEGDASGGEAVTRPLT
jgi:hypothetical protein